MTVERILGVGKIVWDGPAYEAVVPIEIYYMLHESHINTRRAPWLTDVDKLLENDAANNENVNYIFLRTSEQLITIRSRVRGGKIHEGTFDWEEAWYRNNRVLVGIYLIENWRGSGLLFECEPYNFVIAFTAIGKEDRICVDIQSNQLTTSFYL
ncbi:MAG: hypothetical protein K0U41_07075 [Gammaproteobacteria bacterium]|nr:hypothetical protein [Gammaproteobacteria bacterium]